MDSLKNVVGSFFSPMKSMAVVESDDQVRDLVRTRELISNFKKQVVAEERWHLPSQTQDDGAAVQTAEQQGVVVALEDGQTRYLVRRIPNEQKEGVVDVVVTYASHMGPKWVRIEEKQVQNAKLEDYVYQNEERKHETKVHGSQFEDKGDSSDSHKDSEDTACKM